MISAWLVAFVVLCLAIECPTKLMTDLLLVMALAFFIPMALTVVLKGGEGIQKLIYCPGSTGTWGSAVAHDGADSPVCVCHDITLHMLSAHFVLTAL
jgi:hypothetical protein